MISSITAAEVARGVSRLLLEDGYSPILEFTLPNGRRLDVAAIGPGGEMLGVEIKVALADPGQADVPVLTMALDAGFSSLGPFNRAFKAETGVTPSEFRRMSLANGDKSGIGRSIPDSASPPSNPASSNLAAH